jgi:hypothetical protein
MYLNISTTDANIIQVALDHLFDEHTDVLADAIRAADKLQARESYHIQRVIEDLQEEIKHQLQHEKNLKE